MVDQFVRTAYLRGQMGILHLSMASILNKLNQIFVEANLNIAAQFLQTDPKIGYVVVDIETDDASPLLAKLREIEGTIKARVLY